MWRLLSAALSVHPPVSLFPELLPLALFSLCICYFFFFLLLLLLFPSSIYVCNLYSLTGN